MNTIYKFNDSCFSIQKTTNNIDTVREMYSPNCVITQKLRSRLHQFVKKVNYPFVHFHLLLESFKTT